MSQGARIYTIVNQKGGVGKTTTVVNIAAAMALSRKKVLVIDMDPQGNASTSFGIEQQQRQNTIYEVLLGETEITQAILNTNVKNLQLISSTVDLSAAEVELVNVENRENILRQALKPILNKFDYIFIDCPPSLGLLTVNSLVATSSVIIPIQCEFLSLEGLSHLLSSLELIKANFNNKLEVAGIILTMYDRRNKLTEQVEIDVRNVLRNKVFTNVVPRNVKLSEAPSHGLPGIIYDPTCPGSLCYVGLAKELTRREKNN